MNRNKITVAKYRDDINSEISADPSKNSWGVDEWFGFYVNLTFVSEDFDLTRKDIFGILGVIKGEAIFSAIKVSYPELADQLKVTEGGVNINHPDFDVISGELVTNGTVTQEDVDLIKTLGIKQKQTWESKGLPELKVGHIQSALRGA